MQIQNRLAGGFSLIEVMLGMAIFMIGTLGVTVLFISAVKMNTFAGNVSEANSLAVTKIEDLRGMEYVDVISGTETNQGKNGIFIVNRVVAAQDNSTFKNLKVIDLTVSWQMKDSTQQITLRSLRSEYVVTEP